MISLPSDHCSIAPCRYIRQRRNGDHCALALQHRQQILECNREVVAFHRRRRAGREAYAELPEAAKRRFRQDSVDRAPLRGDFLPHAHAVAVDDDRFDLLDGGLASRVSKGACAQHGKRWYALTIKGLRSDDRCCPLFHLPSPEPYFLLYKIRSTQKRAPSVE
jgi:hypothetical protein